MANFSLSPVVSVREFDQSTIIQATSTSIGAIVLNATWGSVETVETIITEDQLVSEFGKPNSTNFRDIMTAANFLAYSNNLKVVRVLGTGALNSCSTATTAGAGVLIKNRDIYDATDFSASTNLWIGRFAGALGNSVGVAWCDTTGFNAQSGGNYTWPYRASFTDAPATNEYHIVVYDATGLITGVAGTILETYPFASTVSNAIYYDGSSAYFRDRINTMSSWIYVGKASLFTGTSSGVTLGGGADGSAPTDANRITGYQLFLDPESIDINLVMAGNSGTTASQWIIQNLAEVRRDCMAFVSPMASDVVGITDVDVAVSNILATRTTYGSSTYAVMDSVYKYQYDKYNNVYRWVPLNGDVAGLCARVDDQYDPWFSPGGYNRGLIKNVMKFSQVLKKAHRDSLYSKGVNPCIIDKADGAVLYGDKTLISRASVFGVIGIRRMFITIEKAIATASKYFLFEQNDDYTRARFVNMVTPFLRDVQGRRGLQKFNVQCDRNNNPDDIVAEQILVADIVVLPTFSINYIRLNFTGVSGSATFDEIVMAQ